MEVLTVPNISVLLNLIIVLCVVSCVGGETDYSRSFSSRNWAESRNEFEQVPIANCFRRNSISCLQKNAFRVFRDFFNRKSLKVANGVTLDLPDNKNGTSRSFKLDNEVVEQIMDHSRSLAERQHFLVNYVVGEAGQFLTRRHFNFDLQKISRSFPEYAAETSRQIFNPVAVPQLTNSVKNDRMVATILTLLVIVKYFLLFTVGILYFAVVIVAKKALIVSTTSILMSLYTLLQNMSIKHLIFATDNLPIKKRVEIKMDKNKAEEFIKAGLTTTNS